MNDKIIIKGARENNLKNIDVKIPLGLFVAVTGVSGSGKSSLINEILYPAVSNRVNRSVLTEGIYDENSRDSNVPGGYRCNYCSAQHYR